MIKKTVDEYLQNI